MARKKGSKAAEAAVVEDSSGIDKLISEINSKIGSNVAFDLDSDILSVKEWIPTGIPLIDYTTCKGRVGGVPVGRIGEISSTEGVGKTMLLLIIGAAFLKRGFRVVYVDGESTADKQWYKDLGINKREGFIYVMPDNLEQVWEIYEMCLQDSIQNGVRYLFLHDSIPSINTINENSKEAGSTTVGEKARFYRRNLPKLLRTLAMYDNTLIFTNQVTSKIDPSLSQWSPAEDKVTTPGGSGPRYYASWRWRLKGTNASDGFVKDEKGYTIGTHITVQQVKSRFGTTRRTFELDLLWGEGEVARADDSRFYGEYLIRAGWVGKKGNTYSLEFEDGEILSAIGKEKFNVLVAAPEHRPRIQGLLKQMLIHSFDKREIDAANFYTPPSEEVKEGSADFCNSESMDLPEEDGEE